MLTANILNLFDQTIFYGTITFENNRIREINKLGPERSDAPYILPGFVDAHVHVESSLLTPPQFARLAVVHGTVATVSDPHEIGNVLGVAGVQYMIEEARRVPFKFMFGAPSCVPATTFETAGATIGVKDVRNLLALKEIGYLAEMMNFPGVLHRDPEVMAKIALAQAFNKPVDGHAPGLMGDEAQQYIDAGITTDHECFTYEEGLDKAKRGMYILIREGSAARNFDALIPLLAQFPEQIMFCSDDKHPDTLAVGHINQLVMRALAKGHSIWNVLRAACLNPVLHYRLPVGLLREGDPADYIVVDNLHSFHVQRTVINGEAVAENGQSNIQDLQSEHVNQFNCSPKKADEFVVIPSSPVIQQAEGARAIRVIEALDGQLITNELHLAPKLDGDQIVPDVERDVLKVVVVNRYQDEPPAVAFIKNFGLKHGAIASSVGHDSHNITAVGCDDESICKAVNLVIEAKGGLSAVSNWQAVDGKNDEELLLPLPVAGLMSDSDGYAIADQYTLLDQYAKHELGSTLAAPFMTLSFMALLVIPNLKLSNKGLFDGKKFSFVSLETENQRL
ncbi:MULTISPECIES: adenine deaminase [unclassified Spirosoma]|uniref:adenine deaminase n=1 Tax=unclassified Spirosoma TaxID=2621999 RepID=UPI000965BA6C|nr:MULTISPECIES: adenine deaminase [unclassified Spirosoma]MBN8823847.1 adenine deaminase [Spirosoma sp.]OJW79761.1 MAG: adenine deaminase [Spirosoma sp. 48-14]